MKKNIFGTDGIRSVVGTEPLTSELIPLIGNAIGQWCHNRYGDGCTIVLAHDGRNSASFIKTSLLSGILPYQVMVYDADVLSTPAVCTLVKNNPQLQVGLMISASHNPYQDNGIKIIDHNGNKIGLEDELFISDCVINKRIPQLPSTLFGTMYYLTTATHQYFTSIMDAFPLLSLHGMTIVIDCANGATSTIAPQIFTAQGATVIPLFNQPNGTNINQQCGSLHTEALQKAVLENRATIGFAFDGDGDRVIAVSRNGIIKDGDDLLALLTHHPCYAGQQQIVGTIMSNKGIEEYFQCFDKQLTRVPVGDKEITASLVASDTLLGGEPSGHIIMRDYLSSGDGIFTALRILETIQKTGNWDMVTFTKYPHLLINVPVTYKKDLSTPTIQSIITHYQNSIPHGRIQVRYSGTEAVLRIMIEDRDYNTAYHIGNELSVHLQNLLSNNPTQKDS